MTTAKLRGSWQLKNRFICILYFILLPNKANYKRIHHATLKRTSEKSAFYFI